MEQQAAKESAAAGPMGQDATFVRRAFAAIAGRYVLTNHVLSLGIDVLWRKSTARAVEALQPKVVLDVATGSGDLAEAIQRACPQATVVGLDFSAPMLQEARKRGLQHLMVADAMNMPIVDGAADVLTVAFGLRNMASWPDALREMSRVLRPGGSLFVLDFSLPTQPLMRKAHLFYLRKVMPKVAGVITGERGAFEYLCNTIEQFPSGENMCRMIRENGFREAKARPLSFGIASLYHAVK
ncbi:ubiquinone/menaquinone biosynthesis methyltransferase [Roseimicrobium sp. ORNL1]|uniref:ubiquinone/menaquinone biosynthesis methyltransferase n=1 Tax=Roseimicrobium sp. ORNL1 TaxID=2711231 RepID=UPI001F0DE904|nr:ubiquinone/menaquinone biosynthesis methyltransferase [Roseimicrobium sp. ORNL1]